MGKGRNRKPFIDKSKATTYNLLYRASEVAVDGEDAAPERVLVDASRRVGIGRPDAEAAAPSSGSGYPPGHPLAFLEEPAADAMSEERRRELIELGLPDDGYDYLKHLRAPGRGGRANLEGPGPTSGFLAGPSVFVPSTTRSSQLQDDARVYDASRLTIHQAAADEDSAVQAMGGVSAFSRQRERLRQVDAAEVAAMEELLADPRFEDAEGFLEDDFVLAATQVDEEAGAAAAAEAAARAAAHGAEVAPVPSLAARSYSATGDSDTASNASSQSRSEIAGTAGGAASAFDARPGSIASTYWRPERSDRKNLLSVVDERFEHLALDYDESDIGSLDEEDPEAQGTETLDAYGALMDEFLASHEAGVPLEEQQQRQHGAAYRSAADIAHSGSGIDAAAAARTIEQSKRLMREEQLRRHEEVVPIAEPARECWDVDSVQSLRSNLDNHPASIFEPNFSRRPRQQVFGAASDSFIPLGRKGIPVPASYGGQAARGRGGSSRGGLQSLPEDGDASASCSSDDESVAVSVATAARRKGETAEEKKARKGAVKEAQRAARAAKKELKGMYKQEYQRQVRAMAAPAPATIVLP